MHPIHRTSEDITVKRILPLAVAVTAGFIAGSKAGHGPYERLRDVFRETAERSGISNASNRVGDAAAESAGSLVDRARGTIETTGEQLAADIRERGNGERSAEPGPGNPSAPVAGAVERGGAIRPGL